MRITLNNRPEHFEGETMTVDQMLTTKKFTFMFRVVKINGKLVKKDDYATALIKDGDDVQMLYLMSGG